MEKALEAHEGGPLFAFIHLWDVHYDYNPPERYWRLFDPDYRGALPLDAIRLTRRLARTIRDRRPDLYGSLLTLDGKNAAPDVCRSQNNGSPTVYDARAVHHESIDTTCRRNG